MTPTQREAALRLINDGSSNNLEWSRQVVALLRELAREPVEPAPGYCKHCKQYTIEEASYSRAVWS